MLEIHINNSYSQILGLDRPTAAILRDLLSYVDNPGASYYGGFSRTKFLIDKKGFFPTGLYDIVLNCLRQHRLSFTTKDLRRYPFAQKPLKIKAAPYKWQVEALDRAVTKGRGGIVATTGSGKTLLIALIAAAFNLPTLVVVPSIEIKKQVTKAIDDILGKAAHKVVVENIDSIKLIKMVNFDVLIIDECHHAAAKTYQVLNKKVWNNIYFRFFLTATFFRNAQNEHLLFEGVVGREIYRLSYAEAVKNKYIVPVEARYVEVPSKLCTEYAYNKVYSQLVVHNDARNLKISSILNEAMSDSKYTLCLVKEIAHGKILSDLTNIPFANGQDEDSRQYIEQFKQGKIKQLIGTTSILGEGVDTRPAELVIIAGLGKAKSAFMQQVGRAVRNYPGKTKATVVIFKDKSHKFTLNHFKEQMKILRDEYHIEPTEII